MASVLIKKFNKRGKQKKKIAALKSEIKFLKEEVSAAKYLLSSVSDACLGFAERLKIKPEELSQLNIGTILPHLNGKGGVFKRYDLRNLFELADVKYQTSRTEYKFRIIKEQFVKYQKTIHALFTELNKIRHTSDVAKLILTSGTAKPMTIWI